MYQMVTAEIVGDDVVFASAPQFDEALRVGFFRVRKPDYIDLSCTRALAQSFSQDRRFNSFRPLNLVEGYFEPEKAQSIHFCLERDHWADAYDDQVQRVGQHFADLGAKILRAILAKFNLPRELWFDATSGASHSEGSCYLVFRHYDPRFAHKPDGLAAHRDWGFITILDSTSGGLEAEIDGQWQPLFIEDGYLIVNFGEPLHKLLPEVNSSNHRVVTQTRNERMSTILFIDPRVGPYRPSCHKGDAVGMVWDWDVTRGKLTNGQTTLAYFEQMSAQLYG